MSQHDRDIARSILGVQAGASIDEITAAWRRLAMEFHPDRQGGDGQKMAEVNAAYDVLRTPEPIPSARRPAREPATYSEYLNMHRRAL